MNDRKHLNKEFVKKLGLSLYIYRLYREISLSKICERLGGLNPSTFCSYENGRREIDVFNLVEVSERYGVSVRKLAKENPLEFLREKYKSEKNQKEKQRIGDIIISACNFVNKNGGLKEYPEWWYNEANSFASEVLRDRVGDIKNEKENK